MTFHDEKPTTFNAPIDPAPREDCATCRMDVPPQESELCADSSRACGHHCDCSWECDVCCWCGLVFFGTQASIAFDEYDALAEQEAV